MDRDENFLRGDGMEGIWSSLNDIGQTIKRRIRIIIFTQDGFSLQVYKLISRRHCAVTRVVALALQDHMHEFDTSQNISG